MNDSFFSTDQVKQNERFAFWHDLICNAFVRLEVLQVGPSPFFGSMKNSQLGDIQFSHVWSSAQHAARTKGQLARVDEECFVICFQLKSDALIAQDGRTALLHPGDWTLLDSTRTYELAFHEDFKQLVLKVPHQPLLATLLETRDVTARTISGRSGLGKLTRNLITDTWQEAEHLQPPSRELLIQPLIHILGLSLLEVRGEARPILQRHLTRVSQIKAFITDQLHNPQLSVEMIADAHNISSRYVHTLFAHEGMSIAHYIRSLRLERCRQMFADLRYSDRTISEIALSWGFNDLAHFSRLFRKQFGMAARSYRQQQLQRSVYQSHREQ